MFDDETLWKAYEAYREESGKWIRYGRYVEPARPLRPETGTDPVSATVYHFSDVETAKTYIETRCIKAALEAVWPRT